MNLYAEALGGALVVHLQEERLDAAIAIRFKDRMREVALQPSSRVVLDLSDVTFLDSSGLGAIVAVMKSLAPARQLELAGLTPTVEKVFRLTRMDTVFRIHPDVAAATSERLRDAG
ncbi:STAS domain-containing protein [Paenirhodobacter hankyongi]|uniref:Anti-sigma factor antagonist n=1 Tax=Paenirhodobacter hankyongi TaxID=2294033 RepID=A0A421BVA8_9RHOB|nr:STAS domain-containing protein [Sinirhodobacter hankyongi]RLL72244.1 anti-sigma factor antagonist [Sinirhodobacter hankyongi]